jgi:hypothetical protein
MVNREFAIIATIAAIMISAVAFGLIFQAQADSSSRSHCDERAVQEVVNPEDLKNPADGGLAVSGNNIYATWNCFSHVLFTKSTDGGKTFANTTLINTPDTNPKTVVDNVTISASGNTVAIMWDSNETGIVNPEIRASGDWGNTFRDIVTLNSTSGGINK